MEGWQLALVLKPFVIVLLLGAVAFFAFHLQKVVPNGKFKSVFFDRTVRTRHPKKFAALVISLWVCLIFSFFLIGELSR